MELQLSPHDLPTLLARANAARHRALGALVALAEALGTPSRVPAALAEAEEELGWAQEALKELRAAREAEVAPAVARGTLGDEDEEELRRFGDEAEAEARRLEREKERGERCQKRLQAGHWLALGLAVLCGAVLSLDAARAALGVAEDSHLLLALATVAVSCQLAAQALATSRRHLGDTARQHRDTARRLRDRAQRVATARATAEATAATVRNVALALDQLEEVKWQLETLVKATKADMVTSGQGFTGDTVTSGQHLPGDPVTSGQHLPGDPVTRGQHLPGDTVTRGQGLPGDMVTRGQGLPGDTVTRGHGFPGDTVTRGHGFRRAEKKLRVLLEGLSNSSQGHGEVTRRLQVALEALRGTGRGHAGGAVTPRDAGEVAVSLPEVPRPV